MSEPTFKRGDIVETVKGAKFWGRIVSFDDDPDSQPGATVLAFHPEFAGTKHVYPLKQLRRRTPAPVRVEGEAELLAGLKRLYAGYVRTLESGRDRIMFLRGACDPVDVMERGDPDLIAARALIAKFDAALKAEDSLHG